MSAYLLFLSYEFTIPVSNSLKSKRRVVKSLRERLQTRFNASVAELSHMDKWQRSTIGMVLLSNDKQILIRSQAAIESFICDFKDIQIINTTTEWL